MPVTNGNFTFIASQQGSVDATTLSLIRSHTMRTVRHKKKVAAQEANDSKRLSRPARLASKTAPSEVETRAAKAVVQDLDVEAWARETISSSSSSSAGYVVVADAGVCPLECVLKRAETLRTRSHEEVLADPGMVDFVNLLLENEPAREGEGQCPYLWRRDGDGDDGEPIKLGPLVLAYLEQHQQNSSWSWGISKEVLVQESMGDMSLCHSFLSMSLASKSGTSPEDKARQLWHENEAIRRVREHLEDLDQSGTAAKDSDIWAVSLVGLQHALYGSPEVAEIHLRGIEQMVSSRGGLAALGFDGQVKHVVELLTAALQPPVLE